jgi:hypothetical protein
MQRFTLPDEARELLQAQQSSSEALEIKRQAGSAGPFLWLPDAAEHAERTVHR